MEHLRCRSKPLPGVSILGLISRPSSNIFFQTFILLALIGGTYVPCIISLLPDKKRETYDVLFGLIHDYLDRNNLPNKFETDFFMTDFEVKEATKLGWYIWIKICLQNIVLRVVHTFKFLPLQVNIRSSFSMFWPEVKLLSCYFHFSQLMWKRVKGDTVFANLLIGQKSTYLYLMTI